MGGSGGFPGGIWGFTGGSGGFPGGGRLHAGQQGLSGGPPGVPCLSPLRDGCPQSTPGTPKGPAPPRGAQGQAGVVGGGGGWAAGQGHCRVPRGTQGAAMWQWETPKGKDPAGGGGRYWGGGGGLPAAPCGGSWGCPGRGDGDRWHVLTAGLRKANPAQLPAESPKNPSWPQKGMGGPKRGWGDPSLLHPSRAGGQSHPQTPSRPPMTSP